MLLRDNPNNVSTFMKKNIVRLLKVSALLLAFSALAGTTSAAAPPHVAVFSQQGFPYYGPLEQTSPRTIAADLEAARLHADLLNVEALADLARFNGKLYAALDLLGPEYVAVTPSHLNTLYRESSPQKADK